MIVCHSFETHCNLPNASTDKHKKISIKRCPSEVLKRYNLQKEEKRGDIPSLSIDRFKFQTKVKQQWYIDIEGRNILQERRVEVELSEWQEFPDEIVRREWKKLAKPKETFNEILVKEFYANAYPMQRHDKLRRSWVYGTFIHYDREAINDFLGGNFTLGGDDLDTFTQLKKNMHLLPHVLAAKLCLLGSRVKVSRPSPPRAKFPPKKSLMASRS
ncbi:hypothetical protein VNO78_33309 [Psophocarpus tetragonolobus]|uniref:Putative plant transposon protein domain-containing protein n=1 Tax=Psophocarpus tetragonolobus TaxID=3891 RepID=A0AAN9NWQ9_PSOTE